MSSDLGIILLKVLMKSICGKFHAYITIWTIEMIYKATHFFKVVKGKVV